MMNCVSYVAGKFYMLACVSLALYMTYLQFEKYLENRDSSSVLYKKFTEQPHDWYPAWSFCFYSYSGGLFKPFNTTANGSLQQNYEYYSMLRGEADVTSKFSSVEYDNVVKDLIGNAVRWVAIDGYYVYESESGNSPPFPFPISYQDPQQICYTRNERVQTGKSREVDSILFDAKYLLDHQIITDLYLHQSGHIMKHLGLDFLKSFYSYEYKEVLDHYRKENSTRAFKYQINWVEILNKRPSANHSCDPNLHNQDEAIRQEMVKLVGCIPTYWKYFSIHGGYMRNYSSCAKSEQLAHFASLLPWGDINHVAEKTDHLYVNPCRQTRISSTLHTDVGTDDYGLRVNIKYSTDVYKAINNEAAFTSQDLWSQIGGFVGIFLGYGLLQVSCCVIFHLHGCWFPIVISKVCSKGVNILFCILSVL